MIQKLVMALFALVVSVTWIPPALGQGAGAIRGQILIPSVRASERIPVTLQRADGPVAARLFTDNLGNFEFRNLPTGTYEILVSVDGYEEVRQQVSVGGGGLLGTVMINIPLNEKRSPVRQPSDPVNGDANVVDVGELARTYPRKAVQDYQKAMDENRKGNTAGAAAILAGVIQLAPDYYAAHNSLGTLYQKMNRYSEAKHHYSRARELNPRSVDPLVNLGGLLVQEADARAKEGQEVVGKVLDDALDILEEAIRMQRSALAYLLLGTAYYKSTFYEEAEANLKLALRLDARMPGARLMLANLYMKQTNWEGALSQLDAYLIENPKAADHAQISQTREKVAQQLK